MSTTRTAAPALHQLLMRSRRVASAHNGKRRLRSKAIRVVAYHPITRLAQPATLPNNHTFTRCTPCHLLNQLPIPSGQARESLMATRPYPPGLMELLHLRPSLRRSQHPAQWLAAQRRLFRSPNPISARADPRKGRDSAVWRMELLPRLASSVAPLLLLQALEQQVRLVKCSALVLRSDQMRTASGGLRHKIQRWAKPMLHLKTVRRINLAVVLLLSTDRRDSTVSSFLDGMRKTEEKRVKWMRKFGVQRRLHLGV